jgi:hypothetical protein
VNPGDLSYKAPSASPYTLHQRFRKYGTSYEICAAGIRCVQESYASAKVDTEEN